MPQGLAIATVDVSFPLLAPNGSAAAPSYSFAASPSTGMYSYGPDGIAFSAGGVNQVYVNTGGLGLYSGRTFYLNEGGTTALYGNTPGVLLQLDGSAANTPQEFRVYGTSVGPKYAALSHDGTNTILENSGASVIYVRQNGTLTWTWTAAGNFLPVTTGVNDLGSTTGRVRSLYLGGNTPAASAPMLDLAQTWNDAGVTFVGAKIAITDTLSGALSKPLQILGGAGAATSLMYLTGAGDLVTGGSITAGNPFYAPDGSSGSPSYVFTADTNTGFWRFGSGRIAVEVDGADILAFRVDGDVQVAAGSIFGWNAASNFNNAPDLGLARLAAASLRLGLAPSATPVAQTLTIGEASRPGTDTNVGGANGTIRSGLGTGTGTASSLIFQTPTAVGAGSSVQTYSDVMTLTTSQATFNGTQVTFGNSGAGRSYFNTSIGLVCGSGLQLQWSSNTDGGAGSSDLSLARLAAASLRLGLAPSATPIAQTLTIGEFSRVGTDNNVAGSDGTIRSGSGTGNAAGSSLFFDTPTVGASGTVQQSYGHRLTLSALGATFDIPDQGLRINNQVNGAGASAGSLTNAPSAGNPNFWLPINIAGTVRYFPGW